MKSPSVIRSSSSLFPLFVWIAKLIVLLTLTLLLLHTLFHGPSTNFQLVPSFGTSNQKANLFFKYSDFSACSKKYGRSFWDSMQPGFSCPQPLLLRVGAPAPKDGGKWTCGINNLGKLHADGVAQSLPNCLVYSFGVSKDSSFEAEVLASTHCDVYAYDPTVDVIGQPLKSTNSRVHFKKLGIDAKDAGSYRTLKSLMKENGDHQWIDILKVDVEGAEFKSLNKIMDDFPENDEIGLPFGQLLLEVHVVNWDVNGTNPKADMVVNFFKRLESMGLRMFTYEVNLLAGGHCCCEVSFINTKLFSLNRFMDV